MGAAAIAKTAARSAPPPNAADIDATATRAAADDDDDDDVSAAAKALLFSAAAAAPAFATAVVTTTLTAKHISAANAKRLVLGARAARYRTPIFAAHAVSAEERSGSTHELASAGRPRVATDAKNLEAERLASSAPLRHDASSSEEAPEVFGAVRESSADGRSDVASDVGGAGAVSIAFAKTSELGESETPSSAGS